MNSATLQPCNPATLQPCNPATLNLVKVCIFLLAVMLGGVVSAQQTQQTTPVNQPGIYKPIPKSIGKLKIQTVARELRVFPSANNEGVPEAAGVTYFYEPLTIFNDDGGNVVDIEKTNDGKFRAVLKVIRNFPDTFKWDVDENYRGTPLKFSAIYNSLAEAGKELPLPEKKILRPIEASIITLEVPGYTKLVTTEAGAFYWTFTQFFETEDEAKKFKQMIESGEAIPKINIEFAVEQKTVRDFVETTITFFSGTDTYKKIDQLAKSDSVLQSQIQDYASKLRIDIINSGIIGSELKFKDVDYQEIVQSFFAKEVWQREINTDVTLDEKLLAYLSPRIKEIVKGSQNENFKLEEKESIKLSGKSSGGGGSFGVSVPIYAILVNASVSAETRRELSNQLIDRIHKEEGVRYTYNEATSTIEPTAIDIFQKRGDISDFRQTFRDEIVSIVTEAMALQWVINGKTQKLSVLKKVFDDRKAVEVAKYNVRKKEIDDIIIAEAEWRGAKDNIRNQLLAMGTIDCGEQKDNDYSGRDYATHWGTVKVTAAVPEQDDAGTYKIRVEFHGDTHRKYTEYFVFGRYTHADDPRIFDMWVKVTYTRNGNGIKYAGIEFGPCGAHNFYEVYVRSAIDNKIPKP